MKIGASKRTSIGQLRGLLRILKGFVTTVWRHIVRFGLAYGFVGGFIGTLTVLVAIVWFCIFENPVPWKITDPANPRFNVEKFRFADYQNSSDLGRALDAIVQVGDSKEGVDLLLERFGARISPYKPGRQETNPPNLYYYVYRNWRSVVLETAYMTPSGDFSWEVAIEYDDNNHVKKIIPINP